MTSDPDPVRGQRYSQIGEVMQNHADSIVNRWVERAAVELPHGRLEHREQLRNGLPCFLEQWGAELGTWGEGLSQPLRPAAVDHGVQRWKGGWKLDEVVRDYQLLRRVLFEYLSERLSRPLEVSEVVAIVTFLDRAVNEAVTACSDYQDACYTRLADSSRGTLENAPVGMAHLALNGTWLRVNSRLGTMLGYRSHELIQRRLEDVTHAQDQELLARQLRSLDDGVEQEFTIEQRFIGRDGYSIWTQLTGSLQRSPSGKPLYYILIVEDITERLRLTAELERAKAAAEEGNRLKSEFVANVSHEIRTPMNVILGMTELAMEEELPDQTRDYLQTAHDSARSLLSLVNDILDFSKIDAGHLELQSNPFSIAEVIDETARALVSSASEKGLELLIDVADSVPACSVGDPCRLRQVLTNLVSNAIKFTQRGEIVIRAALHAETESHSMVRFGVTDTGIGISQKDQQRIFAPFVQADSSTTRIFGGSGLGLTISSELISQMGGRLAIRSDVGQGSEFYFMARLAKTGTQRTSGARRRVRKEREQTQRLAGTRVLVVDDNTASRRILSRLLESLSLRSEAVANVDDALERLQEQAETPDRFDVCLVDALMPATDGFSLIEAVAEDPGRPQILLMLSSADRSTFADRIRALRLDGVLDKPITRSSLLEGLLSARFGAPSRASETPESGRRAVPLQVLVVEDVPANQKVTRAILQKRGHCVTLASNGREAIERVYEQPFDVILMDVQMPTVDGYQATSVIRQMDDPVRAQVPIIAMTAHAMQGDAERCLDVGMNAYLSKPIDSRRLIETIDSVISTAATTSSNAGRDRASFHPSSVQGTSMQESSGSDSVSREAPAANFEAALVRLDHNRQLLGEMMRFFREDAPQLMQQLQEAVDAGDAPSVRRASHSIKGLGANFDALQVVGEAELIEQLVDQDRIDEIPDHVESLRQAVDRLIEAFDEYERA